MDTDYEREVQRLASKYNYPDRGHVNIFLDLLELALRDRSDPTLLDIGCGNGIFRKVAHQQRLRPLVQRYIGVEPDRDVAITDGLFDHVYRHPMELADIPVNSVDVAYAAMVVEHVTDPVAFLSSVQRCLRPGGIFILCTPNANSYFGQTCLITRRLGIDEWLLRKIRGDSKVEDYHYPIMYRMNRGPDLERFGKMVGLSVEVGYTEAPRACRNYFPGVFGVILSILKLKRKLIKNPHVLTHIIALLEKPHEKTKVQALGDHEAADR